MSTPPASPAPSAALDCAASSPPEPCCTLGQGPLGAADAAVLAEGFKALADPMRLRLLSHITAAGCGDVCACDLTAPLGITQPTVSHHLRKLVDAGLLVREQKGRWAHYTVVLEPFARLRTVIDLG